MGHHTKVMRLGAIGIAATSLAVTGCGSSTPKAAAPSTSRASTTTASSPGESRYCDTALAWQVHALAPFDDSDPVATEQWATAYARYVQQSAAQAPAAIRSDWSLSSGAVQDTFLPLLEKYDYSLAQLDAQGSDAEKALLDEPPPTIASAQDSIHAYDATVCAAERPEPADVTFAGPAPKGYCDLVNAERRAIGAVHEGGFEPDAIRAMLTGRAYLDREQAFVERAPAEIRDDVEVLVRFDTDEWDPLVARHDYDVVGLLLDGSLHDREVLNYRVASVASEFARIEAYDEQLCPADEAG